MPLIRAINTLCIVRGARDEARLRFPPAGVCLRGGGLPDAHLGFFAPGRQFRVPGYLATSFDREARPSPSSARPRHAPPIRAGSPTRRPPAREILASGSAGACD